MDILKLFWDLDINNTTKIAIFIIIAIIVLCIICKPKNKKDKYKNVNINKPTKCQIDYKLCKENSKNGNNEVCHICKNNGDYPDKIYNSKIGWINIDPKSGKATD